MVRAHSLLGLCDSPLPGYSQTFSRLRKEKQRTRWQEPLLCAWGSPVGGQLPSHLKNVGGFHNQERTYLTFLPPSANWNKIRRKQS